MENLEIYVNLSLFSFFFGKNKYLFVCVLETIYIYMLK